jgi:type II restriction enzyme
MCREILENRTPNLLALQYRPLEWRVENLILIPHFAFPLSAIKERPPLTPAADRKGWIGYYILFDSIPPDAQIFMVMNGVFRSTRDVRAQYKRIRPLERLEPTQRGWTLDVLNVVRSLRKTEFALADVYAHEESLTKLHPGNKHVQPKIRQQLQELRDLGLLEFLGRGKYRVVDSDT